MITLIGGIIILVVFLIIHRDFAKYDRQAILAGTMIGLSFSLITNGIIHLIFFYQRNGFLP